MSTYNAICEHTEQTCDSQLCLAGRSAADDLALVGGGIVQSRLVDSHRPPGARRLEADVFIGRQLGAVLEPLDQRVRFRQLAREFGVFVLGDGGLLQR